MPLVEVSRRNPGRCELFQWLATMETSAWLRQHDLAHLRAAEYREVPVSLFLYLAGCLHDAIDDLHRLNPSVTGSAADMFDRFLGWPARHTHAYRVSTTTAVSIEEASS